MSDQLIRFPDPQGDAESRAFSIGNDGAFSFIPPYMAACYRAAFVYAVWQGYAATVPPAVYDQTDENGNTPRDPDGSLRHPAGAHDVSDRMGVNADLGYPLLVNDGSPDSGSQVDDGHLVGPPDRCDVNSLAHVVAALVWQELQAVDEGIIPPRVENRGGLWRIINVDGQIRAPLMEALGTLGLAQRTLDRCQASIHGELTDQGTGWFREHYNHAHLRAELYEGDTADALAALWGKREQFELDAIKGGDAAKPTPGVQPPDPTQHPNGDTSEGQPPPPINPPSARPASPPPSPSPGAPATGGAAPAPARQVPAGTRITSDDGWPDLEDNLTLILPDGEYEGLAVHGVENLTLFAENPGGAVITGSVKVSGEPACCLRVHDGSHGFTLDGVAVEGGVHRGGRITGCERVTLRGVKSTKHHLEAFILGDCPGAVIEDYEGGESQQPPPEEYDETQDHALYIAGNAKGTRCRRLNLHDATGSFQVNGASMGDHIEDFEAEDVILTNMGSEGTPALSLMACSESTFRRFAFSHDNADAVLFADGRGSDWACHGNRFEDFVSDHEGKFSVHEEEGSGDNVWVNPVGFDVPAGDRIEVGVPSQPPPPASVEPPHVHPHGPWPPAPFSGLVIMDDGRYGELTFNNYAGATVRAANPGKVTAKALVVGEGCQGLRFELFPEGGAG